MDDGAAKIQQELRKSSNEAFPLEAFQRELSEFAQRLPPISSVPGIPVTSIQESVVEQKAHGLKGSDSNTNSTIKDTGGVSETKQVLFVKNGLYYRLNIQATE